MMLKCKCGCDTFKVEKREECSECDFFDEDDEECMIGDGCGEGCDLLTCSDCGKACKVYPYD